MQRIDTGADDGAPAMPAALPPEDVRVAERFMQSWLVGDDTDYRLLEGISDGGLRALTSIVAAQCGEDVDVDRLSRGNLTRHLEELLEETFPLRSEAGRARPDVVEVDHSRRWEESYVNSAVHRR